MQQAADVPKGLRAFRQKGRDRHGQRGAHPHRQGAFGKDRQHRETGLHPAIGQHQRGQHGRQARIGQELRHGATVPRSRICAAGSISSSPSTGVAIPAEDSIIRTRRLR